MRTITRVAALTAALVAGTRPLSAQPALEAAYLAARDSAIQSLAARVKGGETFPRYMPAHDSALRSLANRLRAIIGPVHAKGFSESGRGNLESLLPGDEGFGMLDALVFSGDDKKSTLWVTTRSLAAHRGRGGPGDLATLVRNSAFYYNVVSSNAAVYDYGAVALPDSERLDIAAAMMMRLGQDDSRGPPEQLLVTLTRGPMIYIVTAPLAVTIQPPHECLAVLDSLQSQAAAEFPPVHYPPINTADSAAWRRYESGRDAADPAFRKCYGDRARLDPRFARVVAQARSLALALP